jgi:rhamnosyl/mannosyltransferase
VDLAFAMNLLTDDTNLALAYGKAARARYEEKFSGSALGKAYADLYKKVVNYK